MIKLRDLFKERENMNKNLKELIGALLDIQTEGKMYEDFQVHRLNSNDANELAKAEKLAKDFVSELNLRGVKKINHSIDYILDPYAVREDL